MQQTTASPMSCVDSKHRSKAGAFSVASSGCPGDVASLIVSSNMQASAMGADCLFYISWETPTLSLNRAVVMISNKVCCHREEREGDRDPFFILQFLCFCLSCF